jgi:acetyl esterase/lipase
MRTRHLTAPFAVLCAAVCLAAPIRPQDPKRPTAQTGPIAGVRVERDLRYVPDGDAAQSLDLYLPERPGDKPLPLVVYVHGGAWRGGSKARCPATFLIPHGYAAASVEYRFSQKAVFPAQIQDCQAAIRWLRANAKTYNLDPERIGAWGDSAGGHLVALLGTAGGSKAFAPIGGNEKESDRVQAVCDFYGPANFNTVMDQAAADTVKNVFQFNGPSDPYSLLIGSKLGIDKEKCAAASPVHHVSGDDAPFLILHGTADALVPFAQSVELADALRQARVSVVFQRFAGAGHGGAAFAQPSVRQLIKTFFDRHLKAMDVKVEPLPEALVTSRPSTTREAMRRVHVRIFGRVQGVGFRAFTLEQAQKLGLGGHVRNCDDGSVEAVIEGPADAVTRLLEHLGRGPEGSRVEKTLVRDEPYRGEYRQFEIRHEPAKPSGLRWPAPQAPDGAAQTCARQPTVAST